MRGQDRCAGWLESLREVLLERQGAWWSRFIPRRGSHHKRVGVGHRRSNGHFPNRMPNYANVVQTRQSRHHVVAVPASELREARLTVIFVPALLWAGLVVGNLYRIQLAGVERWRGRAEDQQFSEIALAGERGAILDRAGRVIAMSVPAASIYARPKSIKDRRAVIDAVAPIVGAEKASLAKSLESSQPFVFLARQVSRKIAEQVSALGLSGVGHLPESKRTYPYGQAASTLIGAVGIDGEGLSGIERVNEGRLGSAPVKARVARDAHGKLIQLPMGDDAVLEPRVGHAVQLTLDIELQRMLDEELEQGRVASGARGAFGVMVNATSGEILAMSQAPSPNFNVLRRFNPRHLHNQAVEATFEPGSILKAVVAAGAVERGVVRPKEMINCEHGSFSYAGRTVHDAHPSDTISFFDVVVRSSNIGMAKVGDRLGRSNLYTMLSTFGFGKLTDIGLPGESAGILRPVSTWAQIDVATHAYGQGIAVTPLQVVRAFSALVNGGTLNPLRLIRGRPVRDEPQRVISPKTSEIIQEMLIGVVEEERGTGSFAAIPGVRIGGKTGTAQKARVGGRGYLPGKYMSSFVGFADGTDIGITDRLVLLVTMDEPTRGSYYGGIVAAPVFQRTMKRALEHLSVRTLLAPQDGASEGMARWRGPEGSEIPS